MLGSIATAVVENLVTLVCLAFVIVYGAMSAAFVIALLPFRKTKP
jgi:hypothetical protein